MRLNLDIFEDLCKSSDLYKVHNQDLDHMLKLIWDKVLPLALKDKPIRDMLIDLLTAHYNATKSMVIKLKLTP